MITMETKVTNEDGLNMRHSMEIVTRAEQFLSEIMIRRDKTIADAKSIMRITTLVATCGTILTITADGPDEEEAANNIKNFIDNGFK